MTKPWESLAWGLFVIGLFLLGYGLGVNAYSREVSAKSTTSGRTLTGTRQVEQESDQSVEWYTAKGAECGSVAFEVTVWQANLFFTDINGGFRSDFFPDRAAAVAWVQQTCKP